MKSLLGIHRILKQKISFLFFCACALMQLLTAKAVTGASFLNDTVIGYKEAVDSGYIENRTNIDYTNAIHKDRKGSTFFTYIIRKFNSKPALTSVVKGFEQRSINFWVTTNANVASPASAAGDTMNLTLKANEVSACLVGNTMQLDFDADEDNGYTAGVEITAIVSSTVITVKPQDATMKIGKNSSTGVPSGTRINITGNAFPQNSLAGTPLSVPVTVVENVTQIQRDFIALSNTAMVERMYGEENERSRERELMEQIHAYRRENSMLLNGRIVKYKSTTNNEKIQKGIQQGFEYTLLKHGKNNQYTEASWKSFLDWLAMIFDPMMLDGNQNRRMCFTNQAGRRWLTDLKASTMGGIRDIQENKSFGVMGVDTVYADSGTLDLHVHPLLNLKYNKMDEPYFMLFHPSYVEYRPLRKTVLRAGIQNGERDGVIDEIRTEETHIVYLPELMGVYRKLPA